MDNSDNQDFRERRRLFKRRRREYIAMERQSVRREKREMRKKMASVKSRIRKEKLENLLQSLSSFFKKPANRRRVSETQKFVKRQYKSDQKRQRKERIAGFPSRVKAGISEFFRFRRARFRKNVSSISGFTSLLKQIFRFRELRRDYLIIIVNSTVLYVLAYLIIYYQSQLFSIFTAKFFDIPAVLYPYRIFWPLYTYSTLYTRLALIIIFGAGPLFSLITGFIFFRIYLWLRRYHLNLKLLMLWLTFHSFNMFFGAYVVGVITRTGFVYTSEWLFLSNVFDVEEIVFFISSIIILVIVGYFSTRHIILAANSNAIIEPQLRIFYILSIAILPFIFGIIALAASNFPYYPVELIFLFVVPVLMVIPVLTNYNSMSNSILKIPRQSKPMKIGWIYIIITVAALLFVRLVVFKGIKFT
jgi:hypothetical protein